MEVSGQLHSLAKLLLEKAPLLPINYLCMQLKCLLSATGNQKWYKLISMCQICTDAECSHNKHLNPAIKSLNAHLFAFPYLFTIQVMQVHNP